MEHFGRGGGRLGNNTTWERLVAHPSHNASQNTASRAEVAVQRKYLEKDSVRLWLIQEYSVLPHYHNISAPCGSVDQLKGIVKGTRLPAFLRLSCL